MYFVVPWIFDREALKNNNQVAIASPIIGYEKTWLDRISFLVHRLNFCACLDCLGAASMGTSEGLPPQHPYITVARPFASAHFSYNQEYPDRNIPISTEYRQTHPWG